MKKYEKMLRNELKQSFEYSSLPYENIKEKIEFDHILSNKVISTPMKKLKLSYGFPLFLLVVMITVIMIPLINNKDEPPIENTIIYDETYYESGNKQLTSLSSNLKINDKLYQAINNNQEDNVSFKILLFIRINIESYPELHNKKYKGTTFSEINQKYEKNLIIINEMSAAGADYERIRPFYDEWYLAWELKEQIKTQIMNDAIEIEIERYENVGVNNIKEVSSADVTYRVVYTMEVKRDFLDILKERKNDYQVHLAPKEVTGIGEPIIKDFYGEYLCVKDNFIPTEGPTLDIVPISLVGLIMTIDESYDDFIYLSPTFEDYYGLAKQVIEIRPNLANEILLSDYLVFRRNDFATIIISSDFLYFYMPGSTSNLARFEKINDEEIEYKYTVKTKVISSKSYLKNSIVSTKKELLSYLEQTNIENVENIHTFYNEEYFNDNNLIVISSYVTNSKDYKTPELMINRIIVHDELMVLVGSLDYEKQPDFQVATLYFIEVSKEATKNVIVIKTPLYFQ